MNPSQVVEYLPVEGGEVAGPLETGHGGHVFLLAEEAHADVVPQLRRLGHLGRRSPACWMDGL